MPHRLNPSSPGSPPPVDQPRRRSSPPPPSLGPSPQTTSWCRWIIPGVPLRTNIGDIA
jgi:hypothetical protein